MKRLPYDVTVSWGKESMARLAQGLILFGAQLTDSYTPNRAPQSREWVYLRVQIPQDRVEAFREYVKPKEMQPAPKADVGVTLPQDPCEEFCGVGCPAPKAAPAKVPTEVPKCTWCGQRDADYANGWCVRCSREWSD